MTDPLHKVTCFIELRGKNGAELLLIAHPYAGVQIPAGTVNPGEDIESAANREAFEESGLDDLMVIRYLGEVDEPALSGHALIAKPSSVYSRPETGSFDWAHFRTGLEVEVLRHQPGFTQVRYEEADHFPDPVYATYSITGWVPNAVLTVQRTRHFFLFKAPHTTPQRWSITTDNHVFELFWAPINNLPAIVPPQDSSLKWLAKQDFTGDANL